MRECFSPTTCAAVLCAAAAAVGARPAATAAPAQEPIPLELFAQLPDMTSPRLSPDGEAIAFLRPRGDQVLLHVQELGDPSSLRAVSPGEVMRFRWLNWASDDRLVFALEFFARRANLVETNETRLLSVNRRGGDMQHIIRASEEAKSGSRLAKRKLAPPQLQDDVVSWLPDDPRHILVAVDGDHDTRFEVRRVRVNNGNFKVVVGNTTGVQYWVADQSGEVRFGYGFHGTDFMTVYRDPGEQFQSGASLGWLADGWRPEGFSADPRQIFVRGVGAGGRFEIRRLDVRRSEFVETVFADEVHDAGDVLLDRYERPVGVAFVDHQPRHVYFDPQYDRLQRTIDNALAGKSNAIVSVSDDAQRLIVVSGSDIDPGVVMLWDREAGTMDAIGERMPGLDPERLSATAPVSYRSADGLEIPAYLTLPRGDGREGLPAVVLPHGGPNSRSDRSFDFLGQFLASRGYAVLQPNFRGSTGYGRSFRDAGNREWGGKMQDDVTAGARWLVDQGIADPDRLAIVGWSYGGYAAAMGAIRTPRLFRCAASINGVLDLPGLEREDQRYVGGRVWLRQIGLEGERLRDASPLHLSDAIEIPLFVAQARDDTRLRLEQATGIADRLERRGKPVELLILERGGHSLLDSDARRRVLAGLERFLASNLGPPPG